MSKFFTNLSPSAWVDNGPVSFTENVFHTLLCYQEEVCALSPSFALSSPQADEVVLLQSGLVTRRPQIPQHTLQLARQSEVFKSVEVRVAYIFQYSTVCVYVKV